jgi:hypothetical protein
MRNTDLLQVRPHLGANVTAGRYSDGLSPCRSRIGMSFDRETVSLLRPASDRAWASVPPGQRAGTNRSVLAGRILKAAAKGERDPDRLAATSYHGHETDPVQLGPDVPRANRNGRVIVDMHASHLSAPEEQLLATADRPRPPEN